MEILVSESFFEQTCNKVTNSKEIPVQVFSYKFGKTFQSKFFIEHL